MVRHILRLAAVAIVAPLLSACGGGAHAVPSVAQNGLPAQNPPTVPSAALRGVMVSVHLPLRNVKDLDALIASSSDQRSPQFGHFITPQQFRENYAPPQADVAAAEASLKSAGFQTYATEQNIFAAAPQGVVESTFGIHIQTASGQRSTLTIDRAPRLPEALTRVGATVAVKKFVYGTHSALVNDGSPIPENRYSPTGPYYFTDLKQAYGYPAYSSSNGTGRTIAIVMAGNIQNSDTTAYLQHEKLDSFTMLPAPVQQRPVNGGGTYGGTSDCCSVEAALDVQQSQGSAPGAHVMLYSIPDLSQDNILAAYNAVVSDNKADIVSSSFGLCELYYTAAYNGGQDFTFYMNAFHDAFRQGNAQGITFVASSGDHGSYECADVANTMKIQKGVSNPANDPDVVAVGGTNLVTTDDTHPAASSSERSVDGTAVATTSPTPPPTTNPALRSQYVRENAYGDPFKPSASGYPNDLWGSGGGISTYFTKPPYQNLANTRSNQRTIPDISMHMGGCPFGAVTPCGSIPPYNGDSARSFDIVNVGGRRYGVIGTSASAPEFAGLLAVTEQSLNGVRLGNANYLIYPEAFIFKSTFRHPPGNNGYPTRSDYDYVVGTGTPNAAAFTLHPSVPLAGDPQTVSNP